MPVHPNSLANLKPAWDTTTGSMARAKVKHSFKNLLTRFHHPISPDPKDRIQEHIELLEKRICTTPKLAVMARLADVRGKLLRQQRVARGKGATQERPTKPTTEPIQSLTPGARPKNPPL